MTPGLLTFIYSLKKPYLLAIRNKPNIVVQHFKVKILIHSYVIAFKVCSSSGLREQVFLAYNSVGIAYFVLSHESQERNEGTRLKGEEGQSSYVTLF